MCDAYNDKTNQDQHTCPHCARCLEDKAETTSGLCSSDDCPRHDVVEPVQRIDHVEPRAVNFEFPLSRLSQALTFIAKLQLIEPVGLHLHAPAHWANDAEVQVCATAWTKAGYGAWHHFCERFNQQCVSLVSSKWLNVYATGKGDPLDLFDAKTVGPVPWKFDGLHFVAPVQARHIEAY